MASELLKVYTGVYNHEVGNLSSWNIKTLADGAIVAGADVDNFTMVELGFNADGERTCTQLSATTKKGYLVAAPETRQNGEPMVNFYNAVGERARVVIFEDGEHFETSAFSKNTGVTEIVNGYVAHFDPATKKFIISNPASAHADYATAVNKFIVVSSEADMEYLCGKAIVKLEVSK